MSRLDLRAIAARYGGTLSGNQCLIPTPGHSIRDRGTAIKLAADAPDGMLVHCYNGSQADALAVKDMLRGDGFLEAFNGRRRELTFAELSSMRQAVAKKQADIMIQHAQVAGVARQILAKAVPADRMHPYLTRKRIGPERLWQVKGLLLVPLIDANGNLWSIQAIRSDGEKRFLTGGCIKGRFWWAGEPMTQLVIGEGVATCAAVRRATGLPVVAAMSAKNLPVVAALIHGRQPNLKLIIAADDDEAGVEAARLASARTGALIALPGELIRD
jgi:putative DNA primase/helicase